VHATHVLYIYSNHSSVIGTYCARYEAQVGQVSDGGLAGIIIGWLLFPLLVIGVACCIRSKYDD
jgi:hypothetical protein